MKPANNPPTSKKKAIDVSLSIPEKLFEIPPCAIPPLPPQSFK
jgi:hypothetical protein